ncbi:Peptidase S41A, C-terminal protease [Crocosphaera watsonii WH 0005]|uniref:Peptidase S41A, C-terminal protease n=1 Tax=Crocosphaera watsonii WH 0005 TaxID=423472 RepID=T2IS71_CROWT|nr:Peptidase S41A, C-terminal protease [Crocosphaera watsonii WH 0005]
MVNQEPISYRQIATKDDVQYEAAVELLTGNSVLANAG